MLLHLAIDIDNGKYFYNGQFTLTIVTIALTIDQKTM